MAVSYPQSLVYNVLGMGAHLGAGGSEHPRLGREEENMSEMVTLQLPDNVLHSAREVATRTHRRVEDVLVEWIDQAAANMPIAFLSDADILGLCDRQMTEADQQELSLLLARHREGQLDETACHRLDDLMTIYRRGLVRKAQAWKEAVARGLKAPLS
jgi:hypothetical protein